MEKTELGGNNLSSVGKFSCQGKGKRHRPGEKAGLSEWVVSYKSRADQQM